jgi:hypothetical protein
MRSWSTWPRLVSRRRNPIPVRSKTILPTRSGRISAPRANPPKRLTRSLLLLSLLHPQPKRPMRLPCWTSRNCTSSSRSFTRSPGRSPKSRRRPVRRLWLRRPHGPLQRRLLQRDLLLRPLRRSRCQASSDPRRGRCRPHRCSHPVRRAHPRQGVADRRRYGPCRAYCRRKVASKLPLVLSRMPVREWKHLFRAEPWRFLRRLPRGPIRKGCVRPGRPGTLTPMPTNRSTLRQ